MKFYCFFEIGEEPEKIKKTLNSITGVSTFSHKTASKDTFFVGSNKKLIMLIKIPKVLILNSNI